MKNKKEKERIERVQTRITPEQKRIINDLRDDGISLSYWIYQAINEKLKRDKGE